ncbi:MAG: YgfZ/GcvT domain-containing protein [Moraxellaceae bacterium]
MDFSQTTAVIPLPSLAVLTLTGPESTKFLQGQATTDFREVEKGMARRGAVCSLKGRVLFSFIAIPDGENVALILPTDQLELALTHLKKYSIFSKTTLTDASSTLAVLGVAGPDANTAVSAFTEALPAGDESTRSAEGVLAVRIADEARFLLLVPAAKLTTLWPRNTLPRATEGLWWAAEIRAGLATIFAATRDLFQPQELNYHAIAAVSYNKGCYTGQEVVARLYFRGKLKQRLYSLHGSASALPESGEIHAEGKQVGDVVMSTLNEGQLDVLAIVKNTAAREQALSLADKGIALTIRALPYALPAEKEE